MTDPDLFAVLDRATDAIRPDADAHQAAASALARARVVRVRRRGLVAGALAAVAVVAVVVATGAGGDDRTQPPVNPAPTTPAVVHAPWDPRDAADLPQRNSVLPRTIELPSDPIELPLSGPARLVFEDRGGRLHLLESDGRWGWTKPPSGEMYATALSDDGTMLASLGEEGLFVTDVREGFYGWRQVELPDGGPFGWVFEGTRLHWQGDTQIDLSVHKVGVATVDVVGGDSSGPDLPDDVQVYAYAVAPGGGAVAFGQGMDGRFVNFDLEDGAVVRRVSPPSTPRVSEPVANETRVVGVVTAVPPVDGSTPEHAGLVVLEREGYSASAYLPLANTRYLQDIGNTLNPGGVTAVDWLNDQTVLLQHAPASFGKGWTLVAWDVETGELTHVSDGPGTLQLVGVARDLVAD